MTATIQAFDDPDGTIYLLRRDGLPDVEADWPHPLYEIAPDAVRLPSVGVDHLGSCVLMPLPVIVEPPALPVRRPEWYRQARTPSFSANAAPVREGGANEPA